MNLAKHTVLFLASQNLSASLFQELMNETSSQFFELTQRKGWIKSVDIVVPKNWSPKNCYNPGKEWIYKRIPTRDKTDIVIGNGNFYLYNVSKLTSEVI